MGFFDFFKKKNNSQNLEQIANNFNDTIVQLFRLKIPGNLSNMTDEQITNVARETILAFRAAEKTRGEHIPAGIILNAAAEMLMAYSMFGEAYCKEHIEYEVNRYKKLGIRTDAKEIFWV